MDLVRKFSADLSFDFDLKRVKDGAWGGIVNGSWNGLVAELINHEVAGAGRAGVESLCIYLWWQR